ncbi:MAG: hypothetical protein HY976_00875 [Candidatus Kerfeldbacteria bacterium]|nr:hypothetical protein [Candidatus Kerfeldbacteria bacterium]
MRANLFTVSVTNGIVTITRGFPVIRQAESWIVPLGECIGCGVDMALGLSSSNPAEVVASDDQHTGTVYIASITGSKITKKLRRPDSNTEGLRAIVMIKHYDELVNPDGDPIYYVAQGTGSVFELYRSQRVQFRCPQGIDRYELSFNGAALICRPLSMAGQPEGEPTQADLASSVPVLS